MSHGHCLPLLCQALLYLYKVTWDSFERRFSDISFRFPLMGTALFKQGDLSDRCFPCLRKGQVGTMYRT